MTTQEIRFQGQCPPVALFIFNRPDFTLEVFKQIAKAKPRQLFIVADGPRNNEEAEVCRQARAVTEQVDWDCEIVREYAETNLGCRKRVTSGLDKVFSIVEEAIMLEDDCIPDPTFFRFCQELLAYYRTEKRVMMISGNNFQFGRKRGSGSYYFSSFGHTGGAFATWRRAWLCNDADLKTWPEVRETGWIKNFMLTPEGAALYTRNLDNVTSGKISSYSYVWTYSRWRQNGLSVVPNRNMVTNIGFDERATHTPKKSRIAYQDAIAMPFPLRHPTRIVRNLQADLFTVNHGYLHYPLPEEIGWARYLYVRYPKKILARLRQILRALKPLKDK